MAAFTSRYVAPAVWLDPRDVTPASDVYSLGLVFYQLIRGQPPLHDVDAVLSGQGPALDGNLLMKELSRGRGADPRLDVRGAAEVIGRMCASERTERYPTMGEVLADLAIVEP